MFNWLCGGEDLFLRYCYYSSRVVRYHIDWSCNRGGHAVCLEFIASKDSISYLTEKGASQYQENPWSSFGTTNIDKCST